MSIRISSVARVTEQSAGAGKSEPVALPPSRPETRSTSVRGQPAFAFHLRDGAARHGASSPADTSRTGPDAATMPAIRSRQAIRWFVFRSSALAAVSGRTKARRFERGLGCRGREAEETNLRFGAPDPRERSDHVSAARFPGFRFVLLTPPSHRSSSDSGVLGLSSRLQWRARAGLSPASLEPRTHIGPRIAR